MANPFVFAALVRRAARLIVAHSISQVDLRTLDCR